MSTLDDKLRALVGTKEMSGCEGECEEDPCALVMGLVRAAADLALAECESIVQLSECEADWDAGTCIDSNVEDSECCTCCVIERRIRAARATLRGGG